MLHLCGTLYEVMHVVHGYAKLVFGKAGDNVRMGVCSYVGVYSECNVCYFRFAGCQLVDNFKFRQTFYVETENILVKAEIYFPIVFPNSCIYNL